MFTKIHAKAGIKKFGMKAVAAMVKGYRQIDKGPMERKLVVTPINPDTLSYKEKMEALEVVNLIKENRNGIIKGRKCGDVSIQKSYLKEG